MTIKEQFAVLAVDLENPSKETKPAQIVAKVMQLVADLQEDATEVPADAFEALGPTGRKIAAMGLTVLVIQSLKEM